MNLDISSEGSGEFLDSWLMLVEKMVNPKTVLESPHSIPNKAKPPAQPVTFNATQYLISTQKVGQQFSPYSCPSRAKHPAEPATYSTFCPCRSGNGWPVGTNLLTQHTECRSTASPSLQPQQGQAPQQEKDRWKEKKKIGSHCISTDDRSMETKLVLRDVCFVSVQRVHVFAPLRFCVLQAAFHAVMNLWNKKPLKVYGSRMCESLLAILSHIIRGEGIIKVRTVIESRALASVCKADWALPKSWRQKVLFYSSKVGYFTVTKCISLCVWCIIQRLQLRELRLVCLWQVEG